MLWILFEIAVALIAFAIAGPVGLVIALICKVLTSRRTRAVFGL